MRIPMLAALAAFLISVPAAAQQQSDGLSGTRVRVTSPNFIPAPVTGTVTSYTQQGIVVVDEVTGDSVRLPLRSVTRLDKFAGGSAASTAWYRGRVGAFIGAGLGLIAGPLLAKVVDREMGEMAFIGGGAGLVSGFTMGAVVGAAAPRERWTWTIQPWGYDAALRPAPVPPVPPQPAAQPQPTAEPQPQTPPTEPQVQPQPQTPPAEPQVQPQPQTPPAEPQVQPQPQTPPAEPQVQPQPQTPPAEPQVQPQPQTPPPAQPPVQP